MAFTRVLLKLSGEQLAGRFEGGVDSDLLRWLAEQVQEVTEAGIQIVIMVGGGNYARGAQLAGNGISRVTADNIGMLATMMNALALADVFVDAGVKARVLTNIQADQVADQFTHRRAVNDLQKGRVVIAAGGIGRPYLTTDTAALSLALELGCDVVLKATKVDGVYDKDPAQHADAQRLARVSYEQAVADEAIKVMDKAALGLAMDYRLPVVIFDAMQPGMIVRAAKGDDVGTRIGDV